MEGRVTESQLSVPAAATSLESLAVLCFLFFFLKKTEMMG